MIGFLTELKKLTMWMIPRIKYWLSVEAAVPKRARDGPPRTKHELFNQAEAKGFGGHVWKRCQEGLRCNACCSILKNLQKFARLGSHGCIALSGCWCKSGVWTPVVTQSAFYSYHVWYATNLQMLPMWWAVSSWLH